jgi:hypothetical protein
VSVLEHDAGESVAARQALDDTLRSATRWIAAALPDGDRRSLGNALEAGARLHVELVLPTGEATVTIEMPDGRKHDFMRVVSSPLDS